MEKRAITSIPISENIALRWSPRAFNPTKVVENYKIIAMCEAARWAPSCGGDEPWRFIIFNKHIDESSWNKAFEMLDEGNQIWVKNAPVIIAGICDTKWSMKRESSNDWCSHDLGAASQNLHLEAVNQGLITHPMAGFNKNKFRHDLQIPEDFDILTMIAVGYPGDLELLDEFNQKRELAERKRKSLTDLFFFGEWNKPYISDKS